jgi:cytochrome oxidase assembly protein ShyY1
MKLGNWQVGRAEEKRLLAERWAHAAAVPAVPLDGLEPADGQVVSLAGEWLSGGGIYLDNRVHGGRPGYHVLAPLRLADSARVVLVNRGWVAAGPDRTRLPAVPGGTGVVRLEGVVRQPELRPFTLAARAGEGRLWQVLDLPAYRAAFGLSVADILVLQTSPAGDGLVRDWPRPDAGVDRHKGYALQWYGLAAAAAVMTGLYVVRKWHRKELLPS